MKHKNYVCDCCDKETTKARLINSGHLLCNTCNIQLIMEGELFFTSDSGLRVKEVKGDFKIIAPFKIIRDLAALKRQKSEEFWEMRRQAKLSAEMDNQSLVGWDCHESY